LKTRILGASGLAVGEVGLGCTYMSLEGRPSESDSIRTIHAALDAGVTLLDTADSYCLGPADVGHNERLIARALREKSHDGVVVATKGGFERPGGAWIPNAQPASLRKACEGSLVALGVARIDVYQLHTPDPEVPIAESVGELARLRAEGKIAHIGLSNVCIREIEEAQAIVPIVSVQNLWNPLHRVPETDGVLAHCTRLGIAFLPYSPFGGSSGALTLASIGTLAACARQRGVSPHRLVLAWMLAKSPIVVTIPGSRRATTATDSAGATDIDLAPGDLSAIERSFTGG
jgi:aryl-alcohol dehydrogenase-like predicted oxidoreductase